MRVQGWSADAKKIMGTWVGQFERGQPMPHAKIGVSLLGVFGLSVNQRRREIGIRMALGAGQVSVLRLILRQGMTLVISGVGLGLLLSFLIGRALSKFLYGGVGYDPVSLIGASLVLLTVATVACYLPARRASQVDPLVALHES